MQIICLKYYLQDPLLPLLFPPMHVGVKNWACLQKCLVSADIDYGGGLIPETFSPLYYCSELLDPSYCRTDWEENEAMLTGRFREYSQFNSSQPTLTRYIV